MDYLCGHHRAQVARSVALAQALWAGAYSQGQQAFLTRDWERARRFFGSAWDIVRIRTNDAGLGLVSGFDAVRLLDTAEYHANTLTELGYWQEAQAVALNCRAHLLGAATKSLTRENAACMRHLDVRVQALLSVVFGGQWRSAVH